MKIKVVSMPGLILTFVGGGITLLYPEAGIPMLAIGIGLLLWWAYARLAIYHLGKSLSKRVRISFGKADFSAVGMSSPYVDFLFRVHNCLPYNLTLTGNVSGQLWNPHVERWDTNWSVDLGYNDTIKADNDSLIRIHWPIPQGNNSPMTEFAFTAANLPQREQLLTFEDMKLEIKSSVARLEDNIGWVKLPPETNVEVPEHRIFARVRDDYNRWRSSNGN